MQKNNTTHQADDSQAKSKAIVSSRIKNLRHLSPQERLTKVLAQAHATEHLESFNVNETDSSALPLSIANGMIENVIGKFELPIGVATNFVINDKEYLIPMVVEEPSVVAAASHMAKIVRDCGGFIMQSDAPIMRAQVQILGLDDLSASEEKLLQAADELIELANSKDKVLLGLGGGCKEIEVHRFEQTPIGPMLVLHLLVDVRDAMGANTVNTMAEMVAPRVEQISGGVVRLRILSNLADRRLVKGKVSIPYQALTTSTLEGKDVAQGIVEAYALAVVDPYRATTHNKGIMNGIDPIVIATGNDWRAVEAGAHAWAANSGRYQPLSLWHLSEEQQSLIGTIEMPMALGIIGGATKTHPSAQAALQIMNVQSASELAQVVVAVGLAQNMAALKALATDGIQKGHMALHARNIAILGGAQGSEIERIAQVIVSEGDVNVDRAKLLVALAAQ